MSSIRCRFSITWEQSNRGGRSSSVGLSSQELYLELRSLGLKEITYRPDGPRYYGCLEVDEPEGSERLTLVLRLLAEREGLTPSPRTILVQAETHKHFGMHRVRQYQPSDIQQADMLRLIPEFRGWPRGTIGDLKGQSEDEVFVVKADKRQKNRLDIGTLYPTHAFAIGTRMKEQLEAADLKGLRCEPIRIEPPERAIKPLWKISSTVLLPRCLLPLQQDGGGDFAGDLRRGCYYDDAGYKPEELRYRQSEVEALEPFDVAVTAERTGMHPDHCFRQIIVSQRVRELFEKLKIKAVNFVPVRLV